jgi:hypothetical protein
MIGALLIVWSHDLQVHDVTIARRKSGSGEDSLSCCSQGNFIIIDV